MEEKKVVDNGEEQASYDESASRRESAGRAGKLPETSTPEATGEKRPPIYSRAQVERMSASDLSTVLIGESGLRKVERIKCKYPQISSEEAKRIALLHSADALNLRRKARRRKRPNGPWRYESKRLRPDGLGPVYHKEALAQIDSRREWVAIVPKGYPYQCMRKDQMITLRNCLVRELMKVSNPPLVFCTTNQGGFLALQCMTGHGMELEEIVKSLKPWPGAELVVKRGDEFPQSVICSTFIVREEAKLSDEEVLSRLQHFNGSLGISTEPWRIVKRIPIDKGEVFHFSLDPFSFKAVKERKFNVFFGLSQIRLKPIRTAKMSMNVNEVEAEEDKEAGSPLLRDSEPQEPTETVSGLEREAEVAPEAVEDE